MNETGYLALVENILKTGQIRPTRNSTVLSVFSPDKLSFDLRDGFPLLTTKKMFFRGIVEELLFFLRGETDSKILEKKGVNIWRDNTTREFLDKIGFTDRPEGDMGPMYGYQWRFFGSEYHSQKPPQQSEQNPSQNPNWNSGIDQLQYVIDLIKSDPTSRRILMTAYNPNQAKEGVLYPCHSIVIQFYVDGNYLDLHCYNRSQDIGLGVPFNIASTALLLAVVAKITDKIPRFMHITMGDAHIYSEHVPFLTEQLTRKPYQLPNMTINRDILSIEDINTLKYEDFSLTDYKSHSAIFMPMIP